MRALFKKLACANRPGKLQPGKGSSPVSRPATTLGGACTVSFFQKYIWEILRDLCLVHNTICSDSQCKSKTSKFLLIWSPQLFEFFYHNILSKHFGLQYFPKIKVTKISAYSFLTFSPYKQLYHPQY